MVWYHYKYNYPVQTDVTVKWFTPILIVVGLLYVIGITLVNVVAVGYDTIVFTSTEYNETHSFWFNKLSPWKGNHRRCNTTLIKLNDCILFDEKF
jgi:hypothetical protein